MFLSVLTAIAISLTGSERLLSRFINFFRDITMTFRLELYQGYRKYTPEDMPENEKPQKFTSYMRALLDNERSPTDNDFHVIAHVFKVNILIY